MNYTTYPRGSCSPAFVLKVSLKYCFTCYKLTRDGVQPRSERVLPEEMHPFMLQLFHTGLKSLH